MSYSINCKYIDKLQRVMYDNIDKYNVNTNPNQIIKKKKILFDNTKYEIKEIDKLFWIFYIFYLDYEEYTLTKNKFELEKTMKIDAVMKLRDIKSKLKIRKIKLNETEDELANKNKISILTFYALCVLYNLNVLIVYDKYIYKLDSDIEDDDGLYNVILCENNNYSVLKTKDALTKFSNNRWIIDNIHKPLKAMSSYTLSDLQTINKTIGLPIVSGKKNILKKDLYQALHNIIKN